MTHRLHIALTFAALVLGTAALVGCNTKSHGVDDAGTDAGADSATDTGTGGEACGPVTCAAGQVCCNASCGICLAPGESCPAIACADGGPGEIYCGTAGLDPCPGDMFCDYGPSCGEGDEGGICRPPPSTCPEDCPGVCGCDGLPYCNSCLANAAGTSAPAETGPCVEPPPPAGIPCGARLGATCDDDEFCDFGESTGCDFADGTGTCQQRPSDCDTVYAPVCGCDAVTYANACVAHAAGVDHQGPGECATTGDP